MIELNQQREPDSISISSPAGPDKSSYDALAKGSHVLCKLVEELAWPHSRVYSSYLCVQMCFQEQLYHIAKEKYVVLYDVFKKK